MNKKKIEVLELLRFCSMTEVFLIHYMNDYILSNKGWKLPMVSGKLGVAFFFMITAYLLVKTTNPTKSSKDFILHKITQLLPKYEIVLFLIFCAGICMPSLFRTFDISIINYLKSAFLFPYRSSGVQFSCPLLPVAWTLIVQFFVMALYWINVKIAKNNNTSAISVSLLLVVLYIFGILTNYENLFCFTYCRFYMLYFVAGFIFAALEDKILVKDQNETGQGFVPLLVCLCILIAFLMFSCVYKETLYGYMLCVLFFVLTLSLLRNLNMPKSILFLGNISYSFFLLHYPICKVFTRFVGTTRKPIMMIVFVIVAYCSTVLASWVYDSVIDHIIYRRRVR